MPLSRMVARWPTWMFGVVVTLLWLPSAQAQMPRARIPADAKGYQVVMLQQDLMQGRYSHGAQAAPRTNVRPIPLQRIVVPALVSVPPPQSVAIRGPDGRVRSFVIRGGKEAIRIRADPDSESRR